MDNYKSHSFAPVWSKLGVNIKKEDTIDELLRKTGMDFEVELGDMYTKFIPEGYEVERVKDGYKLHGEGNRNGTVIPDKGALVPGIYSTYRTDTFDVLGVVGSRYEVIQNREVMEFFMNIINNLDIPAEDVKLDKAGVLYKGAQLFMSVRLPNYKIGNDDIAKYLLFVSSHDGSKSISVCFTDVRIHCSNMLNSVISNSTNKVSIKHTINARSVLNISENIIHKSTEYSKAIKKELEYHQTIWLEDYDVRYLTSCLIWKAKQIEYLESIDYNQNDINTDIISTRSFNKYKDIINTINTGVGQDGEYVNTLYWWYNGVLCYINHTMSYKSDEDKFTSITEGTSNKFGQKAYELCVEYCNFNTK